MDAGRNCFYAPKTDEISALETENGARVRARAGECMVLLENDGTLPLSGACDRIALYGNGARRTVKGGTGSGDVNAREVINIEQGLKSCGVTILTEDWLDRYDRALTETQNAYMDSVRKEAEEKGIPETLVTLSRQCPDPEIPPIDGEKKDTDTAVYVLARNSGEGSDRNNAPGDYLISGSEMAAIRFLAETYNKFILLLNVGGVIDLSGILAISGINAILHIGQMGNMGGLIVSDVLFGKTIPSGKLTDTWAAHYEDYPSSATFSHNSGDVHDEYYTEGIYVGYRYFDTFDVKPLYPFGYGKSYTDFSVTVRTVTADGDRVELEAEVKNTGSVYAGREVVQVYYSAPQGRLEKPYQELAAFGKTGLLAPGESEVLKLSFSTRDMASYDTGKSAWIMEPGDYILRVGTSSADTEIAAVLTLDAEAVTVQLGDLLKEQERFLEISAKNSPRAGQGTGLETADVPKIALSAAAIAAEKVIYREKKPEFTDTHPGECLTLAMVKEGKVSLEDLIAQLSVREMAELLVGTERREAGADVIGAASKTVPGAAGETPDFLMDDRKIMPLILADGPAGLRLQPHFKAKDGKILPGGEVFGLNSTPFPEDTPADAEDYYQYCTAIPIASTLAQSWDMDLIREFGEIVGTEMQKFHVHLWLAPGMNIHRNPLCGRNFEYYSEDPLLSGKCAAACTIGVQNCGRQGTTIKHFAGNNQEDNRMYSNSHIKERALREIYLKGFEIAIRESAPLSIMTSYNLINGTHAANHIGMLRAAREEWGFDGLIMTDWYTSQEIGFEPEDPHYPCSSSPQCVKAGNDVQMPGCEQNVTDIVDAVEKTGELSLADLQDCVYHILSVVLRCM